MKNSHSKVLRIIGAAAIVIAVSGCAGLDRRDNGVLGAAVGGVGGAVIGGAVAGRTGAVVGAGVGAAAGAAVGHDAGGHHSAPRHVEHTRVVEVHEHHHHGKVKRKHRHHPHYYR